MTTPTDGHTEAESYIPPAKTSGQIARSALLLRMAGSPLMPFATLSAVGLPDGIPWANRFALLNALSWSIVLGTPLFLYAKNLGADDAALGFLAALPPLLAVLHIPGNHLIPRLGYRRMLIFGWGSRTAVIFLLALVPFALPSDHSRLVGVFVCIMTFSTLRGLAGGAWMPWVTSLIPPDVRGKFFLRDQLFGQSGNLLAIFAATIILLGHPQRWQFSLAFIFAGFGGLASVLCLLPLPDISTPEHHAEAGSRVPLLVMLAQRQFRQLCLFNIAYMLVLGALAVFTVDFLRGVEGFSQSAIVLLSGMSVLGGIISLFWCGAVIDRIGSRPIIRASLLALILVFTAWWAVAAGIAPLSPLLLGVVYLLSGVAGLNFAAANNRLQSLNIPKTGRNHHFAVLLVALNVAAGISPLLWGFILELIGNHTVKTGLIRWNRYSIFFGCGALFLLPILFMGRKLVDHLNATPAAVPAETYDEPV